MNQQDSRKIFHTIALLTGLVSIEPALAMEAPDAEAPEEIIVRGQQSPRQLRVQIELAQDLMFGLFNELNDDDRYDIHCYPERRTGALISQRVCQPMFLRNANALHARAFLEEIREGFAVRAPPPQAVIEYHYPILREKMNALVEQNPEFAESVAKHHELIEEYEGAPKP